MAASAHVFCVIPWPLLFQVIVPGIVVDIVIIIIVIVIDTIVVVTIAIRVNEQTRRGRVVMKAIWKSLSEWRNNERAPARSNG